MAASEDVSSSFPFISGLSIHILPRYFSALLAVLVAFLSIYAFYQWHLSSLSTFPGPRLAALTNYVRFHEYFAGHQHLRDADLHRKYGPVVRVAPSMLLFSTLDAYQAIYGFNSSIEKGDLPMFAGDPNPANANIFQARTEKQHTELRRKVMPGFKNVNDLADGVEENARLWVAQLKRSVKEKRGIMTLNIAPSIKRFVCDAATEVTFGRNQDFIGAEYDRYGQLEAKDQISLITFGLPLLPTLAHICAYPPIVKQMRKERLDPLTKEPKGMSALARFVKGTVEGATSGNSKILSRSIAGSLASVPRDDNRRIQSESKFLGETFNISFAGQGSTSSAISTVLLYLAKYPTWQAKLREEVKGLPEGTAGMDIWNEAQVLQDFVREAFRLLPPFSGVFERVVAKGGESVVPGVVIPAGTRVGVSPYVLLRSKDVYGPDAEQFKPERWSVDKEERKALDEKWIVFGRGSRACIGKNVALMVIAAALKELLENFEVTLPQDRSGADCVKTKNAIEVQYDKLELTLTGL